MDHGLEAHVDFAAANDLGHIGRIVRLQDGNFDALFLEVAPGLSDIERGMVWRSVPFVVSESDLGSTVRKTYQLVRNVILSVDMTEFRWSEHCQK